MTYKDLHKHVTVATYVEYTEANCHEQYLLLLSH